MASSKKKLPQEGTSCSAVGESLPSTPVLGCPTYSGGGNDRLLDNQLDSAQGPDKNSATTREGVVTRSAAGSKLGIEDKTLCPDKNCAKEKSLDLSVSDAFEDAVEQDSELQIGADSSSSCLFPTNKELRVSLKRNELERAIGVGEMDIEDYASSCGDAYSRSETPNEEYPRSNSGTRKRGRRKRDSQSEGENDQEDASRRFIPLTSKSIGPYTGLTPAKEELNYRKDRTEIEKAKNEMSREEGKEKQGKGKKKKKGSPIGPQVKKPKTGSRSPSLSSQASDRERPRNTRSPSPVESTLDRNTLTQPQMVKVVQKWMGKMYDVVRSTGNMKKEHKNVIMSARADIQMVMESLTNLSVDEETRRLRADNVRLARELELVREELQAFKRDVAERLERQKELPEPVIAPSQPLPAEVQSTGLSEELKAYIARTVGTMVGARIEGLEMRLPPAPPMRPPLAGDREKMPPPSAPNPSPKQVINQAPLISRQPEAVQQRPAPAAQDWNEVLSKREKKRRRKAAATAAAAAAAANTPVPGPVVPKPPVGGPQASKKAKTNRRKKTKLDTPRSSAIVITVSQEAAERGVTYAQAISKARQAVKVQELGIESIKMRQSQTGARIIEIPGSTSGEKADLLASRIQTALEGVARVHRPVKTADLRVSGIDDSVSEEDLRAVVAEKGGCTTDQIKVGPIRTGPARMGTVIIKCPLVVAKKVVEAGRFLIGWSSPQIKVLEPLPTRCFKCMVPGHMRQACPCEVDRSNCCYRCGEVGHKAASCSAKARCLVCAEAKLPADHVMGGKRCSPPVMKKKTSIPEPGNAVSQTGGEAAPEVIEMDH